MNAITGISELILREEISKTVREYAMDVKNAGTNLLSIINDILDFSKIESGKMEIVNTKYLFNSLINDVIAIIRMRLTEKHVDLAVNVDCKLPNSMVGDEVRIRQILLNLLSNAVKYTHEGWILLKVRGEWNAEFERENASNFKLIFEITDTGIGIKEDDIKKLFSDFVQFDTENNKKIEGTGLGLAITRKLCVAMGGDIGVVSKYGEGSKFTAVIPQKVIEYTPLATVDNAETKKVLIYETVDIYMQSISESLDNLGVESKIITCDEELSCTLAEKKYNFIFLNSFHFDRVKRVLDKAKFAGVTVLFGELGNFKLRKDVRFIALPAHSIAIANVLNNVETTMNYNENGGKQVRFTAPDAHILVVDDIITNLKVVEGLMSPYNMQIITCIGGEDAIYSVQENKYDIVFMDHMMPGMDGVEATSAIRSLEGEYYKKVPIIALTANAISGMREMFMEKGFNDYLSKPIEISKMDEILTKWIPKKKQIKANYAAAHKKTAETTAITIEGVDTVKGLAMTGGTEAGYRKVLTAFYGDARERLPLLAKVPAKESLTLFKTNVHALKSAAGTIGAAGVSNTASELEAAANKGDLVFIENRLSGFYQGLKRLTDQIELTLGEEPAAVPKSKIPDFLPMITELASAMEQENIDVIRHILAELDKLPLDTKTKAVISGISDKVIMGEFEEASATIKEMLAQLQAIPL
ncbi:hypothetical protein FACS189494_10170 [Spirochaetia bacterium]|nr:hypothetical protein FACS189494_10170 [Spirochaetia bacterium]